MIHDPKKRKTNLRKHHVDLDDCYEAFDAPMVTPEDTSEDYGEQRFVSLGLAKGKSLSWSGSTMKMSPD